MQTKRWAGTSRGAEVDPEVVMGLILIHLARGLNGV
jgi:hypothetical protein